MEIGSEFWLDHIPTEIDEENYGQNKLYENSIFTASGRSAITLLLQKVKPKFNHVLLPAFLCDSMILPFTTKGYQCSFYGIDQELKPIMDTICKKEEVGIILHMGYFGYPTNRLLHEMIPIFRDRGTIIVEDITHTLFSESNKINENDYTIASIRKWFGTPCGGFLASAMEDGYEESLIREEEFLSIRLKALLLKGKYMQMGCKSYASDLKEQYLQLFSEAEERLDRDRKPYGIDFVSKQLWDSLDTRELVIRRRKNFSILMEGVKGLSFLSPVFDTLPEGICPMFYPVYIPTDRDYIRHQLSKSKVYCPIHWLVPKMVCLEQFPDTAQIYHSILSIPCDQRYEPSDMQRVIEVLYELDKSSQISGR